MAGTGPTSGGGSGPRKADRQRRPVRSGGRSSADRAEERGDYTTATSLLSRCAEFSEGTTRAHALTVLAAALAELNDFTAAMEAAAEARSVAVGAGDERHALRADLVRTDARSHVDPSYPAATIRMDTESVLHRLEELGDEDGVFRALLAVGRLDFYEGQTMKSLAVSERLFERARGRSYRDRDSVAVGLYTSAVFGPPPATEALDLLARAGDLVGASILGRAVVGSTRAVLLAMQDRPEDARSEMAGARELWGELGDPSVMAVTHLMTGNMEQILGRPDRAEQGYRDGVELLDRLGETGFNSTFLAGLANALCEQGRFDDAEEAAGRSQALTAEGDFASEAGWREARSLIASSRGEHDTAIEFADAAIGHVAPTDYVQMIGEAHVVRGVVLGAAGRSARAAFDEAIANFERKGIVPLVARIRERLASLDHPGG